MLADYIFDLLICLATRTAAGLIYFVPINDSINVAALLAFPLVFILFLLTCSSLSCTFWSGLMMTLLSSLKLTANSGFRLSSSFLVTVLTMVILWRKVDSIAINASPLIFACLSLSLKPRLTCLLCVRSRFGSFRCTIILLLIFLHWSSLYLRNTIINLSQIPFPFN